MDELRRHINAAFDNEQSELGNLAGTRNRLLRNALAARQTRSAARIQLVAGIAAVVLAVIVIATFALVRAGNSSHSVPAATPTPRTTASPAPLINVLNVPNSTPIIAYGDPAKPDQVDGITWDGKISGTLPSLPVGAANPANNLFANSTEIRDRSGLLIASGTFGLKSFAGTWADDELHFCQMVPLNVLGSNDPATLQLVTPGSAPRSVVQVGRVIEQAVLRVAACSVRTDQAVVVQGYGNSASTAQYWVVQLSTGKILWTHQFDISNPVTVVASLDGQFIAENAPAGSTIFGSDGSTLANLNTQVEGFSSDGSLVVTDHGYGSGTVSVVAWRTGSVVWSAAAGYALSRVEAQPDGSSLAIWIAPPAQVTQGGGRVHADLYVIASDGKVIAHIHDTP